MTLIVAAAGCGKTIALDEYLATLDEGCIRFNVGAQHNTLAGFIRGFRVALAMAQQPDIADVDAESYDGLLEALEAVSGTIVLDGLQVAQNEEDVVRLLASLIERTKPRVRWLLSSRSTVGLPIGTWLAYGDCDGTVDAGDLAFTLDEARAAALDVGIEPDEGDLREILEFTGGWATAVGFALRAFHGASDTRRLRAAVREASHQFLAEQVYAGIPVEERDLLALAAALPEIDVRILNLAGFEDALRILEAFRARTALLHEEFDGLYRLPTLFRDFLQRQTALVGAGKLSAVHVCAARALEVSGGVERALDAYVTAGSQTDVLRLLESHGFDLLERGRSDATSRAIETIDEKTRHTNPRILALRGVLQSLTGNPVRAEALLRRSLSRAKGDREIVACSSLRLAMLITNQGGDIAELLVPLTQDSLQEAPSRAEAFSLLAAQRALAGDHALAKDAMVSVERLLADIDIESVRAKVLQRIGVAAMYIGAADGARKALAQAAGLAMELHLYSLASRAFANLSNLMLHHFDDVDWQLWYAEQASEAALKAANAFDIETAALQLLDAEMRCGRRERSAVLEDQLAATRSGDQSRLHYIIPSKALRLAWEGRFSEAHRLLAPCWDRLHHNFDRLVSGAQCALYLAIDGRRKASVALTAQVSVLSTSIEVQGPFTLRSIAMAHVCLGIAEALNGRSSHADRIISRIPIGVDDQVVLLAAGVGEEVLASVRRPSRNGDAICSMLERLASLGYAHMTLLLESVKRILDARKPDPKIGRLTRAEAAVLQHLAEGFSPKEIAARRGCSIHTVRAHTANAISKLRCNGRGEAIARGRHLGILD